MPKNPESSTAANNSTCTAPIYEWKTLPFKKINQFICRVENFVYLCIGKRTVQGTQNILEPHICGVLWAVPVLGTVRLPKHNESLALFVHTCK